MAYAKAIGVRFRDSWLVRDFEQVLNPYLRPNDSVLFIPAGKYRYPRNLLNIDAYYLDIDEKVLSGVDEEHKFVMDMFEAEKLGRQFDVVVSDPPYTIPYDKRFMFLRILAKLANCRRSWGNRFKTQVGCMGWSYQRRILGGGLVEKSRPKY